MTIYQYNMPSKREVSQGLIVSNPRLLQSVISSLDNWMVKKKSFQCAKSYNLLFLLTDVSRGEEMYFPSMLLCRKAKTLIIVTQNVFV